MDLTFVVGTGRCGSTLLSRMLHLHPEVLSMSEFFSIVQAATVKIPVGEMEGEELWTVVSKADPIMDAQIRAGLKPPELSYPLGVGRYNAETGLPLICHNVLPLLSDDPDSLFDRLAGEVCRWPKRAAADQYLAVFRYLAALLGRRVVVERSGASVVLVPLLHDLFPEARFVHMYRNGADCALSMSRHPTFRRHALLFGAAHAMGLSVTSPPEEIEAAFPERLRGRLRGLIAPPFDAERLMTHPIPVSYFGQYWWSGMVCVGASALGALPKSAWIGLRYEDLVRHPEAELTRLAGFIGVTAMPRWLRAAGEMADTTRCGTAAAELDPVALASVRQACEPGVRAIARLGTC